MFINTVLMICLNVFNINVKLFILTAFSSII